MEGFLDDCENQMVNRPDEGIDEESDLMIIGRFGRKNVGQGSQMRLQGRCEEVPVQFSELLDIPQKKAN